MRCRLRVGLRAEAATTAGPPNVIRGRGRRSMALLSRHPPFPCQQPQRQSGSCILGRNRTTYLRTAYHFLAKHPRSWNSPSERDGRWRPPGVGVSHNFANTQAH